MAGYGTVTFEGTSGTNYEFTAYSRDTDFNAVGAVYFMTKRTKKEDGGFSHTRLNQGRTRPSWGRLYRVVAVSHGISAGVQGSRSNGPRALMMRGGVNQVSVTRC